MKSAVGIFAVMFSPATIVAENASPLEATIEAQSACATLLGAKLTQSDPNIESVTLRGLPKKVIHDGFFYFTWNEAELFFAGQDDAFAASVQCNGSLVRKRISLLELEKPLERRDAWAAKAGREILGQKELVLYSGPDYRFEFQASGKEASF